MLFVSTFVCCTVHHFHLRDELFCFVYACVFVFCWFGPRLMTSIHFVCMLYLCQTRTIQTFTRFNTYEKLQQSVVNTMSHIYSREIAFIFINFFVFFLFGFSFQKNKNSSNFMQWIIEIDANIFFVLSIKPNQMVPPYKRIKIKRIEFVNQIWHCRHPSWKKFEWSIHWKRKEKSCKRVNTTTIYKFLLIIILWKLIWWST